MSLDVCIGLMSEGRLFFFHFAPIHTLLALQLYVKAPVIDKAGRNPICGNRIVWEKSITVCDGLTKHQVSIKRDLGESSKLIHLVNTAHL